MKLKTARWIKSIWDRIESEDPDISTEMLIYRVQEELGDDDNCRVTDALEVLHDHEESLKKSKS